MESTVRLRVTDGPFWITGRGLAVIGEMIEGDLYLARVVTVEIPLASGGVHVEEVPSVSAARHTGPPDRPALIFPAERGTERAEQLRAILQPGMVLTLTGPAVIPSSSSAPPESAPPESLAPAAIDLQDGGTARHPHG
jgi:hypothetical protein